MVNVSSSKYCIKSEDRWERFQCGKPSPDISSLSHTVLKSVFKFSNRPTKSAYCKQLDGCDCGIAWWRIFRFVVVRLPSNGIDSSMAIWRKLFRSMPASSLGCFQTEFSIPPANIFQADTIRSYGFRTKANLKSSSHSGGMEPWVGPSTLFSKNPRRIDAPPVLGMWIKTARGFLIKNTAIEFTGAAVGKVASIVNKRNLVQQSTAMSTQRPS